MKFAVAVVQAVMARRILINFRARPEAAAAQLPAPFQPKVIGGWALGGICLIRLERMRPRWLPGWLGLASENAAHRFAVLWEEHGSLREGVFIPRRDTDSHINQLAGGRMFPGVHHPARFRSRRQGDRHEVALRSRDGQTQSSLPL
jgi:hypothetical protein